VNPKTASLLGQLREGTLLYTTDGKELGRIKEFHDEYLKIDASMARDYWLHASAVTNCEEGVCRVSFPEADLDLHRLKEPAGTVTGSPLYDETEETFGSEAEQEARRERMEHPGGTAHN
jgi:hypothetical protein